MYELKIGFCERLNRENSKRIHHEYFSSPNLNAAKSYATRVLKTLEPMEKYITGRQGNKIRWTVWSAVGERGEKQYFTDKQSAPIYDHPETVGFCQLEWDDLQLSLFEDMPVSA